MSRRRDPLAGSVLVAWARRAAQRFSQKAVRAGERVAAGTGIREALRRLDPFHVLCALLASAVAANLLTLWIAGRRIPLWGAGLRWAALGAALLGGIAGRRP